MLQCVAVCWSGLHRAVECCSVLQCVAMVRIRTSLVRWKSNRGVFVCVASVFVCVCVCERERKFVRLTVLMWVFSVSMYIHTYKHV